MNSRRRACRVFAAALLAFGVAAGAAQEIHVRGPNYDGRVKHVALELPWPAGGPPVVWRRTLGQGFSGMVVADERVFTQVRTFAGQFVVCLDLRRGTELWRTRTNWPWEPSCPQSAMPPARAVAVWKRGDRGQAAT